MRVDPAEIELDPVSREWLDEEGTFTARKNVEPLRGFAASPENPDAGRRIVLRFLRSPVEIRGGDRVEAVDIGSNEIVRSEDGALRPRPLEGEVETIECGLVLRSVGYRAVPLPDVPFDERAYVLPNERGRVLTGDGEPLLGVYAVGWIKRGPTGILGTNKRDAEETVASPRRGPRGRGAAAAREAGARGRRRPARRAQARRRDDRGLAGDRRPRAPPGAEEERPRVKLASREELLAATKG